MTRHEPGRGWRRLALAAWLGLLALTCAWEAWGAAATPVPRGFWLALAALPLAAALPWLWRGGARAHVVAALLALLYFAEGVALAYDGARRGELAALACGVLELALAGVFVAAAGLYARLAWRAIENPPNGCPDRQPGTARGADAAGEAAGVRPRRAPGSRSGGPPG